MKGFHVPGQRNGRRVEILPDFMKKELVEMIEARPLQPALGKIRPQDGGKLTLVQDIHPRQLGQAVQRLGRGDAHPGGPSRCHEFEDHRFQLS